MNRRLCLPILSAIALALVVNLAISVVETGIQRLKPPEEAVIAESLKAAPKTTVACVTKTVTASATTAAKVPMLVEAAGEKPEEAERGVRGVQGQLLPFLLNASASLIIAASSFLLLRRILG